ncbi:MAG: hypothetical protein DMG04_28255 [Acidobacteria bacterium]|nr:MAG: hypothetical protein DMG04_28255 [Acidobacteriota bacterium]PYQ81222.1 MAG: hypothetical protein DMG03_20540 [Acidobacteriota bacterium]PYQ86630.1 MAG: hypothetical protein DMG02_23285 [Acidobacteriota bacterium]
MQYDSGYPSNWMPDVVRLLPKQVIEVVPAGAGVGVMKFDSFLSFVAPARRSDSPSERPRGTHT